MVTNTLTPWDGGRIINISRNAIKAHIGLHTDGADEDFVIDDAVAGETLADCQLLITPARFQMSSGAYFPSQPVTE